VAPRDQERQQEENYYPSIKRSDFSFEYSSILVLLVPLKHISCMFHIYFIYAPYIYYICSIYNLYMCHILFYIRNIYVKYMLNIYGTYISHICCL